MGGIEYNDGGCVEKKKGESLTSTRLINGLWGCPPIDINARSMDCHATDALELKMYERIAWLKPGLCLMGVFCVIEMKHGLTI